MIINKSNLSILTTGFKSSFQEGLDKAPSTYDMIATTVPSSTASEDYGWLADMPRVREWAGERIIKDIKAYDYSIKNKKYESTVGVKRDSIDDDQFGVYSMIFRDMGESAATHPDELVYQLLSDGFATTCFDGQFFFDTDHPVNGSVMSNMQAGAEAPWFLMDTRKALKPLIYQQRRAAEFTALDNLSDENVFMREEFLYGVSMRDNVGYGFWQQAFGSQETLDQTNFDAAFAAMGSVTNDEGQPLNVLPNLLVCGVSNRAAANQLLEAQLIGGGNSNTNYKAVELLIVPWLA